MLCELQRLKAAREEIEGAVHYSHWIINDDLEQALDTFSSVVVAGRVEQTDKQAMMTQVLGV